MKRVLPIHKKSISKFLFEQEEEDLFATDEEGGDEAADEGGDEAADEGGEEGEEAEAGEEEEEEEATEEEADKLGKAIDDDLEALLVDFETQARKTKKLADEELPEDEIQVSESFGLRFLLEADYSAEIDLERFTSEVARLIKNYDTLLDMESLILSKAKSFIMARYGDDAVSDMEDSLADNHGIEVVEPPTPPDSDLEVPVAAGAGTPAGAA